MSNLQFTIYNLQFTINCAILQEIPSGFLDIELIKFAENSEFRV